MRCLVGLREVFLLLLLFIGFATVTAQVQTARYNTPINANTKGFYEYVPQGYSSGTGTYPLIIFLHGKGNLGNGDAATLPRVLWNGLPKLIKEGGFPSSFTVAGSTYKFIVISPQFVVWPSPADVEAVLNYAINRYRVNVNRVYLTGISMGGGAVWDFAGHNSLNANRIAAAVPICGSSYPEAERGRVIAAANLPVWATHNTGDEVVPVSNTQSYIGYINTAPAPVPAARKTIFNALGHNAWTKTYDPAFKEGNRNIYEWMLQYQRSTLTASSNSPVCYDSVLTLSAWNVSGASYKWTGPTGFTSTLREPTIKPVTAAAAGTYTVTLTKGDSTATASTTVVVSGLRTFYYDGDKDGYGTSAITVKACRPPWEYRVRSGDCIDTSKAIYAGALEIADTLDNDCNGKIDDITTRYIKVNLFGGVDSYNSLDWNNWNADSSLNARAFRFQDTSTAPVRAVLSASSAIMDNGATYGGTMAPPEVLRHASVYNASRTLTLSGLTRSSTYNLELYASRNNTGNSTKFTINGISKTVVTDRNRSNKVSFTKLLPTTTGQLVVNMATSTGTYNYLNGFVLTETLNKAPVVNAGANKAITLPTSSVTLSGTATDADGTIATYKWTQVSGPAAATFGTATSASTTVSNLKQGTYVFRLTATDNKGATARDDVAIVVNGAALTLVEHITDQFGGIVGNGK